MHDVAYRRLYNTLKEQILQGEYQPGARLPTEQQLCEQHGVSRITSRHALRLLQQQGLVHRQPGKGTFVHAPCPRKIPIIDGDYVGSIRREAPAVTRQVVSDDEMAPPQDVERTLELDEATRCRLIERVDILEGVPLAYDRVFLPTRYTHALSTELLTSIEFLPRWLEMENIVPSQVRQTIEALRPDERSMELLGINRDQPLLLTTELIDDDNGTHLMLVETYYRGDRVELIATSTADSILPSQGT